LNDRLRRRLDPSRYTQHPAATRSLSMPFSSATSVQFWAAANSFPPAGAGQGVGGSWTKGDPSCLSQRTVQDPPSCLGAKKHLDFMEFHVSSSWHAPCTKGKVKTNQEV
jgi:hypothetical protein